MVFAGDECDVLWAILRFCQSTRWILFRLLLKRLECLLDCGLSAVGVIFLVGCRFVFGEDQGGAEDEKFRAKERGKAAADAAVDLRLSIWGAALSIHLAFRIAGGGVLKAGLNSFLAFLFCPAEVVVLVEELSVQVLNLDQHIAGRISGPL